MAKYEEFNKWVEVERAKLPDLARRIFLLRDVGGGTQWDLERSLGRVMLSLASDNMVAATSWSYGPNAVSNQVILRTLVDGLYEDVCNMERAVGARPLEHLKRDDRMTAFWVDDDPDEKPFGPGTVGVVSEVRGGIVAYFGRIEDAEEYARRQSN